MSVFLPSDWFVLYPMAGLFLVNIVLGFLITRLRSVRQGRLAAWLLLLAGMVFIDRATTGQPSGFIMGMFLFVLYPAMKVVVCVETQALGGTQLSWRGWLGFSLGWFGMKPEIFAKRSDKPLDGAGALLWFGISRTLLGTALLLACRWLWTASAKSIGDIVAGYLVAVIMVPAVSFIIHFGVPNIVAGCWRYAGVDCRALFRSPFKSHSLGEFWGRRWNLAFSEMATLTIYRPLSKHIGQPAATVATFGFSGLLHELALSVPVGGGYGLPTLYFLLHAGLVFVERWLARHGMAVDRINWVGRLWTFAWVAAPLPLLVHLRFLTGMIWPFMGMDVTPGS